MIFVRTTLPGFNMNVPINKEKCRQEKIDSLGFHISKFPFKLPCFLIFFSSFLVVTHVCWLSRDQRSLLWLDFLVLSYNSHPMLGPTIVGSSHLLPGWFWPPQVQKPLTRLLPCRDWQSSLVIEWRRGCGTGSFFFFGNSKGHCWIYWRTRSFTSCWIFKNVARTKGGTAGEYQGVSLTSSIQLSRMWVTPSFSTQGNGSPSVGSVEFRQLY